MPNYQDSKIYKIVSPNTDKIYIGSTTQKYLCNRMQGHICSQKRYYKGKRNNKISSWDIINAGDAKIILIEKYPCNSKEELHAREYELLQQYDNCINMYMPTRKFKEWLMSKDEEYKKKRRERCKKVNCNPEQYMKILENKRRTSSQKIKCETCNIEMRRDSIWRHKKTQTHVKLMQKHEYS